MCGGGKAPAPVVPATPPPPPPVLEQAAPEVSSPTASEAAKARAAGTKKYRSSLAIGSTTSQPGNSLGLGISA